ncbi:hypothetical protein ABPG74_014069 [Tetrahymena malaccensis]
MEDQPNYSISMGIYQLIVFVYFIQLAGYLYYDNKRVFTDQYANIKFQVEYISTSTYLLSYKGNDNLIYVVFGLMSTLMYFQMVYLIYITYLKMRNKKMMLTKAHKNNKSLNQYLNTFYFLYQWILFIPFFEINSGTAGCSEQSFFVDQRDVSNCNFPQAQTIFSCIGMSLALIIGYNVNIVIKNLVLQTLVISQIYDLFWNLPFRNPKIIITYIVCFVYFEMSFLNYLVLVLDYSISDQGMVQSVAIFTSIVSAAIIILWNHKYQQVMKMDENSFQTNYKYLDFYLEELQRISQLSQGDNLYKQKIQQQFISHQKQCTNIFCFCHTIDFKVLRRCVNYEEILNLIDSIFQWSLQQSVLIKDQNRCEQVSLKYISFVAKYLNNSTLSYYRLRQILFKGKKNSFYFNSISKLLSKRIELMMEERIKDLKLSSESQGSSQKISIKNMHLQDQARNIQIPLIVKYIHQKIKFWQSLKNEDVDINYLSAQIRTIGLHTLETLNQFQIQQQLYDKYIDFQSPILLKIESIFKAVVENDLLTSVDLQKNVQDMLNKQQYQSHEIANYLDLMKGSLILIQVSLVKNPGSILNKNKSQILNLFQFSQNDNTSLTSINQLMPNLFGNIHNDLMKTSVIKGFTRLFSSYNQIFAQNKYGFLVPVKLKVDQLYEYKDDFVLNGSIFHTSTSNQYIILNQYGFIEGISEYLYEILFQDEIQVIFYFVKENSLKFKTLLIYVQMTRVIGKFNILFLIHNFFNLIKECNQFDQDINSMIQSRTSLNTEKQSQINYDSEYQLSQQVVSLHIPRQSESKINQFYELHQQYITKEQQSQNTQKKQSKKTKIESQKVKKLFKKFLAENQQMNQQTQEKKDFKISFDFQHKILKVYNEKIQQFQKHNSYYVMQITEISQLQKDSLQTDFDNTNYSPTQHKQFTMQSNDQSLEKSISGLNFSVQSPPTIYKKQLIEQNKIQESTLKPQKKIDFFENFSNSKLFEGSNLINQSNFAKLDDLKKIEINNNPYLDSKLNTQFIVSYPEYQMSPNNQTTTFSPKAFTSSQQIITSRQIIQTELTQRGQMIKNRETQHQEQYDESQKQEQIKQNLYQSGGLYPDQYKSSTKIEKNQSDQQFSQFANKRQLNNKLENEIHQQTSLSSSFIQKNKYQNNEIRKIIQIKNIPILKLPFLIINFRFLIFLSFMIAASLITSLQINQIYNQIDDSMKIGEFIKFYSESYLMNQKKYLMNENLLDSNIVQTYADQIQNNLNQIQDNYDQFFYDQAQIINTLQDQDKLYNITNFVYKQQYSSSVTAFEFFLNAINSIWVLGKGDIIKFINQLYFLVENYLDYCQMISDFNEKLFSQLLSLKNNLKVIYIILIITLFIIIVLLVFIGVYCIYRLIQYKQKIILLVARLSMKDVDKEIIFMNNFLNYLQDKSFSWQDFNFPEYIISHSDSSYIDEFSIKGSYVKKPLVNSKQQILNETALSGVDSKHKKRLTTQSSDKRMNKFKHIKEQENSKINHQSLISSKVQGQSLTQWKQNLLFMTSLIICGIFYLIVMGISYVITQGLDPSFSLLQQTSEFYTNINKALLLSQNIISLPLISNVDSNYPNQNLNQEMNNLINCIYSIQLFNNNYLEALQKVSGSNQEDVKVIDNLFTKDICNYFQDNDLCLNPQSQSQNELRNIIKNGVSGLITYYITHFDNIIEILNSYTLSQSQQDISQYLNSENNFYFIINSYDIPFQSINLIFQKVVYINQQTISQLLNLTLIYFVTFGAILIAIQMIVDIILKSQIKNNVLLHHISLSMIPIQIQALDTTSQILKSIYKF